MPKIKQIGAVWWYLPKKKKPFAYSTTAIKLSIVLLSRENMLRKVKDVYNLIEYDLEAKAILQKYIDEGYGEVEAYKLFGFDRILLTDEEIKTIRKKKQNKSRF